MSKAEIIKIQLLRYLDDFQNNLATQLFLFRRRDAVHIAWELVGLHLLWLSSHFFGISYLVKSPFSSALVLISCAFLKSSAVQICKCTLYVSWASCDFADVPSAGYKLYPQVSWWQFAKSVNLRRRQLCKNLLNGLTAQTIGVFTKFPP